MNAGEIAPKIIWTAILRSPESGFAEPPQFRGRVTVIMFLPSVSANLSMVSQWNELAVQFSDRPVTFVWLTTEQSAKLDSFLEDHPVEGFLMLDAGQETANAYGLDMAGGALVNKAGRIAGFTAMIPTEVEIDAVLYGRPVHLAAEPHRLPRPQWPEIKPSITPSSKVHISISDENGTSSMDGPDRFVERGFELRALFAKIYGQDPSRIVMPASLEDGTRYDVVLIAPRDIEREALYTLVRQGIEKYFAISVNVETRKQNVYVMTALEGKMPAANMDDTLAGGFIGWSGREYATAHRKDGEPVSPEVLREILATHNLDISSSGISEISAHNSSMETFRLALEQGLDSPIVDETNLDGEYDLEVKGRARSTEEFLQMLRDQTGLLLTPAQRDLEMLIVESIPADG